MISKSVVLIHGMWSTPTTVSTLQRRLEEKGYRVHSPNLPYHEDGIQDSESKVGDLSILDYAHHLKEYIAHLHLEESPILMGHSMGGLLVQKLSEEIDAAALVLLAPVSPSGINIINPSTVWATLNIVMRWGFWRKSQKPSPYRSKYALFNLLERETQDLLYDRLIPESGRAYFEIVFWFLDGRKATFVDATKAKAPLLVIAGGKDRIILKSVVEKVAAKYPQAEYRCYDDHSHWLIDEPESETIVDDIDTWLKAKLAG